MRASIATMPRMRRGDTASARPNRIGASSGTASTSAADRPSSPSRRMPAKPRVVGASAGASKKRLTTRSSRDAPSPTSTVRKSGDWHSSTRSSWSRWPAYRSGRLGSSSLNSSSSCSLRSLLAERKSSAISAIDAGKAVSVTGSPLDRDAHGVAPLGPRAVVVAHRLETEQVRQDEPRVRRALADAAVRDHVVRGRESLLLQVDGLEVLTGLERAVLVGRTCPRHGLGAGDVSAAHRTLLRVVGHVQQLARVLAGGADVDEWLAEMREHVVLEGTDRGVVTVGHGIVHRRRGGHVTRQLAALGDPLCTAAVEEPDVLVPEEAEDPQRIHHPP